MSPEVVGITAGVFTAVSMLPQLIKLIKEKKAADLSYGMLIVLWIGLGCWIWYGFLRSDIPIIVTNGFSLLVNCVMIFFTIKYKEKK